MRWTLKLNQLHIFTLSFKEISFSYTVTNLPLIKKKKATKIKLSKIA